jgi:hypothetical protein
MAEVHGGDTDGENESISDLFAADTLVLEEGVEPSCPVKGAGF